MKCNYHNFKPKGMIIEPCNYRDYLWSSRWKRIRKEVIKRDRGVCQCCLRKIQAHYRIIVHHLSYDNLFNEELTDLTTMCTKCHGEVHCIYPLPRYKMFKGRLLRIAVPSRESIERARAWMRRGKKRATYLPRDADYYADRIMREVAKIEYMAAHNKDFTY